LGLHCSFWAGRFSVNWRRRRTRSNLGSAEKARCFAVIAPQTLWELVKGRELDGEASPRQQQPWRTRCPRLCESGAAMREAGWWSSLREASAVSRSPAYCSPWTPRYRGCSPLSTRGRSEPRPDGLSPVGPATLAARAGPDPGRRLRGAPHRRARLPFVPARPPPGAPFRVTWSPPQTHFLVDRVLSFPSLILAVAKWKKKKPNYFS
jgi:hypothetical protein